MIHKITAISLTFLITVSAFSAYGVALRGCPDPFCCCQGAAMTGKMVSGQTDREMKMQAVKGCCCGEGAGDTCSLKTVAPVEKIGWALLPHRFDPPAFNLSGMISMADTYNDSLATFHSDSRSEDTHPDSPPIYLTAMSFLN